MEQSKNRYGYCCINLSNTWKVGRKMKKAKFLKEGINLSAEMAYQNFSDMFEIIKWNVQNGIYVYRMSSDMIPWMSEYQIKDLPNYEKFKRLLEQIGNWSIQHDIRLGFHPGHFSVLASLNQNVVKNAIKDINQHAEIMDLMGLPQTPYYGINIHINCSKPSKDEGINNFILGYQQLSLSAQKRLTVENDDKPAQFSVSDLYKMHQKIGIPIVFDFLHYKTGPKDDLNLEQALNLAISTWPKNIQPLTHYSSTRKHEDPTSLERAHADYVYEKIETFGINFDVEIEAKAKDLALIKYIKDYL